MEFQSTNRRRRRRPWSLLLVAASVFCSAACKAASFPPLHRPQQVAPIERRPPPQTVPSTSPGSAYRPGYGQPPAPVVRRPLPRGEHLAQWMNQHRSLTPQQQQDALGREPGFNSLPPQTQQRMRDRLAQLDAMNPQKRERLLERNEAMERLSPDQRAEVRGALGQLGSLPPDQRMAVARTFRALRDLPAGQRIAALDSGRFGPPMNEVQRATLNNLLRVEPMLPPPHHTGQSPPTQEESPQP